MLFLIAAAEGRRTSYPSLLIFPGGAFNSVCFFFLCVNNLAELSSQPIVLKFWLRGYFDRRFPGKVWGVAPGEPDGRLQRHLRQVLGDGAGESL